MSSSTGIDFEVSGEMTAPKALLDSNPTRISYGNAAGYSWGWMHSFAQSRGLVSLDQFAYGTSDEIACKAQPGLEDRFWFDPEPALRAVKILRDCVAEFDSDEFLPVETARIYPEGLDWDLLVFEHLLEEAITRRERFRFVCD